MGVTIDEMKAADPRRFRMAAAIRALALDGVKAANSGHTGMPMGMADVATVLFEKQLRFDPAAPDWPDRDRFVLSAGHGSMLLYALLHLAGYPGMGIEALRGFRQLGQPTAGHPEHGHAPGIETTTGPLGQGLATAVGMAIAEESLRARFGAKICNHRTWVIAGDGCLMEGVSQEAIGLAGRLGLKNLIVLWDDNGISIDGKVSLSDRTDQEARIAASGWVTRRVDGHNTAEIEAALDWATKQKGPVLLACATHIGLGAPTLQDTAKAHGAITGDDEIAGAKAAHDWPHGPFEVPQDIAADWRALGARGAEARAAWQAVLAGLSDRKRAEFERIIAGEMPTRLVPTLTKLRKQLVADRPTVATRKASEMALAAINPVVPETIGGSADLTGSNNTKTPDLSVFDESDRKGRYVYYGIREHGMAAAMNGLALHGGVVPYGGTFLVFSDYARPAMRLSALMGQRVVYVMTHDSIGLGEDGPTHQPVEHLAALRAMPNCQVIRPADAVETAEAWEVALSTADGPTVLALSRQNLATQRVKHVSKNQTALGAYVLAEADHKRAAVLIASGSEVEIAMGAKAMLEREGIGVRVVSMPCMERFAAQDEAYRRRVLPAGPVRVAVEAGVSQSWDRWLTAERGREAKAAFVGMSSFGASAPYKDLYTHFGITPEAVAEATRALLG
ncbi:MAG: transketolase [Pseudomonadota bacterium]